MVPDESIESKTGKVLFGFVEEFLNKKGGDLINYFKKNKFGLLPSNQDYSDLQETLESKKNFIKEIDHLIGKPKTFNSLVCGIHLFSLPYKERIKLYKSYKAIIYKKYKKEGITMFNMGCTGFIYGYIKLLQEESIDYDLSKDERVENFVEMVFDWEERSFFVDEEKSSEIISRSCRRRMEAGKVVFFVFAAGNQIKKTKSVINSLGKNEIVKDYGYKLKKYSVNSSNNEVVWFFRKKTLLELS